MYGDSAASRVAALDGRRVATRVGNAVSRVRRAGSSSSAAWEGIAGDQFCGALSDAERQLDDLRERITPAAHLRSAAGPLAGGLRLCIGCSVRPRRLQRGDETVDLTEPGGQLALEGVEVANDRRHLVQVHREAGYDNRCSCRLTTAAPTPATRCRWTGTSCACSPAAQRCGAGRPTPRRRRGTTPATPGRTPWRPVPSSRR